MQEPKTKVDVEILRKWARFPHELQASCKMYNINHIPWATAQGSMLYTLQKATHFCMPHIMWQHSRCSMICTCRPSLSQSAALGTILLVSAERGSWWDHWNHDNNALYEPHSCWQGPLHKSVCNSHWSWLWQWPLTSDHCDGDSVAS